MVNKTLIRLLASSLLSVTIVTIVKGHTQLQAAELTRAKSLDPSPEPVAVIEVTLPSRDALDELTKQGYDIDRVRDNVAVIYATADELDHLATAGYDLRIIEWQPKPPDFAAEGLGRYHSYASLTVDLQAYAAQYPDVCRLYTLGRSVQGRELWAILITDNPDQEEDEPEFKYVATMHGDESLGTEMCLYFLDLLLANYGTDQQITGLVDSTTIWIVPLMNPDGLEMGTRRNVQGYDLNRSFPAYPYDFTRRLFDGEPLGIAGRQPEVVCIMGWTAENSFVLSANFHTGALVVNYPYDDDGRGSVDSPSPDDLLFEDICRRYSVHNTPMWNSPQFPDGITNGAAWYYVIGGMQDWNYRYVSCNETTIELSNDKMPPEPQIPSFWSDNQQSMLSYLEAVHIGVRGIITDRPTGQPLYAEVRVQNINHSVFTDPHVGDYHRMLLPGTYNLTFHSPGYASRSVNNVSVIDGPATRVDIQLIPLVPDLDADGLVNLGDFGRLARYWNHAEPSADIAPLPDGDGIVDSHDLVAVAQNWLASPQLLPLPGQAANPDPPDNATDVSTTAHLDWTLGPLAISHDLYFGTTNPPPFIRNQISTKFDPIAMAYNTTYFWRIDETNTGGKTTGQVWNFKTEGKGRFCFPANTLVWVDGKARYISEVGPGQLLAMSEPFSTQLMQQPRVESIDKHGGVFSECYDIMLETGRCITVVGSHFFLADSSQWTPVQNLTPGSRLQSLSGPVTVTSITRRQTPYVGKVYNLKIKASDRYFVGRDALIARDY